MGRSFDGLDLAAFTAYDSVPEAGIERAAAIMREGRMFRYSTLDPKQSEVYLLEQDFKAYMGAKYALGVNSCGSGLLLALIACGVTPGDQVLVPGFTFTAVPSAILGCWAVPIFVECDSNYRIDIDDLAKKITPATKYLLLSHMRGHIANMGAVVALCKEHGITLIEDSAHALGSYWSHRKVGAFGSVSVCSFQSNKIINAGEGGMITTDSEELFAKMVYLSGAYEANCKRHGVESRFLEEWKNRLPLHSVRMTNITAAMARPQIPLIAEKAAQYRKMYAHIKSGLTSGNRIQFPDEFPLEVRVPDSIQFRINGLTPEGVAAFAARMKEAKLPIVGFAEPDNARHFENWGYAGTTPNLPQTRAALANAFDMRLSLALTRDHLDYLVEQVRSAAQV